MKILGIVGKSGVGKSYISAFFAGKGALVIDGDAVAHQLMSDGGVLSREIASCFGQSVVINGKIDRKALSEIVFSDPKKLKLLNKITHKRICAEFDRLISESDAPFAVIDAAALIESNYHCDYIIAVTAPRELSLSRICSRDNLNIDTAGKRLSAQHSENFYTDHADFVIENDGRDINSLLEEIYEKIN